MKKNDKPYIVTQTYCGSYVVSIRNKYGSYTNMERIATKEELDEFLTELDNDIKESESNV